MAKLRVVGFDPSLNNWGVSEGVYCTDTESITISALSVITPVIFGNKQVRQNSKDLSVASQLATGAWDAAKGAHAIFVEVPIGSQSARAMASYGICVGVLGAMQSEGIMFFQMTPTEIKMAAVGNKNATKSDMIEWAMNKHPDAPWPTYIKNGQKLVTAGKAEHMADATAAIHAGVKSILFKQLTGLSGMALNA